MISVWSTVSINSVRRRKKEKQTANKPSQSARNLCSLILYNSSICQSIGVTPCASRNLLVWLNGLLPKNPRYAESGLGCGASRIKWFGLVSILFFICAGLPQRMNTIGLSWVLSARIAASVNSSHPIPRWEFA